MLWTARLRAAFELELPTTSPIAQACHGVVKDLSAPLLEAVTSTCQGARRRKAGEPGEPQGHAPAPSLLAALLHAYTAVIR